MPLLQSYLSLVRIHPISTISNSVFGALCMLSAIPFLGIPFPSRAAAEYYATKNHWIAENYGVTPRQAGYFGAVVRTGVGLGVIYPTTRPLALALNAAIVVRGTALAWRDGRPMLPQYGMLATMAWYSGSKFIISTTMSVCADCFKGVEKTIGGVKCYVATPSVHYPQDKAILFLSDAFGLALSNNKEIYSSSQTTLLGMASMYVFLDLPFRLTSLFNKTIVPDLFDGNPAPTDAFDPKPEGVAPFDFMSWLGQHGREVTRPIIDKVVKALKEEGITKFAAPGYCFGARYVVDLAFENIVHVAAISHPSLLAIPDDLHKYKTDSQAPLLINNCTTDHVFPVSAGEQADAILGHGNFTPGYKRVFFEGCTHGFAVRGDLSDPKVKAGKEGAFKSCVEWFNAHL
ncbi:Dienelactone hydrolase endo-1,3,1,4-beta-D-glucanase [Mycena indigotica]|uniref:Dienelactone hydrolase endo-1,3,1,4-beta-D-glucanase n=1 Tax=Mycena indigotica TaxID=2126181 RepID=A0A8H6VYU2_9AGAR|nr:Dienelactone hydrolase endo-1,3,1,4-beta-D-glucanase [Mycena indigotica]KAF7298817.1 Dienelactone hydrolase endo-1,3,1,4-beta-D-glucanase [Mycena indigotica]